jgi:YebC/PmpR family DNA-binding regulatory protein
MSGHSKWSTIKRKKGKADQERGKIFSRLIKEITIAARQGGGNPEANARLRTAIDTAKSNNMPAANIDRAIARGTGDAEGVHYEEITYEGYGPGGVAMLVDVATDNRNRTGGEIRNLFSKNGGNMAEAGAVGWMFEPKGVITIDLGKHSEDEIMEWAIEAGADDVEFGTEGTAEITTSVPAFESVKKALTARGLTLATAELSRSRPTTSSSTKRPP